MTRVTLLCLYILSTFSYSEAQQAGASCTAPIGGCLGGTMCQSPYICVQDGPNCCASANIINMTTTTAAITMPQPTPPPVSTVLPTTTTAPTTAPPTTPPPTTAAPTTAPATTPAPTTPSPAPPTTPPPPPPTTKPTDLPPPPVTTTQPAVITVPPTFPPPVTVPPPVVTTTVKAVTAAPAACVDLLNPNTGVSDCPKMTMYCSNLNYLSLMAQQCPRSCGFCTGSATTPSAVTCVDLINPNTGVSDCPGMASYCNSANYYTLMTNQCPKTCGRCAGGSGGSGGSGGVATTTPTATTNTCVDLINPYKGVSDCPAMAAYCNNANYYTLMKNQCPKTCGLCTATAPAGSTCFDLLNPTTGVSDCPQMIAYCYNANYASLMKQQCAKSCGYCTAG